MPFFETVRVALASMRGNLFLHEAAHGYAARYFGDSTAWMLGRVSLNPMKHIDPVGTILLPLLLYFTPSGAFLFGYAKPVPVRFDQLRHPKRDMIWVALAGPGANFLQALLWGGLLLVLGAGSGVGLAAVDVGRAVGRGVVVGRPGR